MLVKKVISIKKKIRNKLIIRGIICLIIAGVILFAGHMTTKLYRNSGFVVTIYSLCAVIIAFIVYKISFFQLLFDKDYNGKIIYKKLRHGYYVPYIVLTSWRYIRPTVYMDLIIRTDRGREIQITYNCKFISERSYSLDDNVRHIKGSKYILILDDRKSVFCPMCATTLDSMKCSKCNIYF